MPVFFLGYVVQGYHVKKEFYLLSDVVDFVKWVLLDRDSRLAYDVEVMYWDAGNFIPIGSFQQGTLFHVFQRDVSK